MFGCILTKIIFLLCRVPPIITTAIPKPLADVSDSESDRPRSERTKMSIVPSTLKPIKAEKPIKGKGRGRPRKIRPEGSEAETPKKQRGRPPGTGKRGRPPKVRQSPPPSSSEDEVFEKPQAPPRRRTKSKKDSSSSDSDDSPSPSPARRRPNYRQESDKDSSTVNNNVLIKKKSSKSPKTSEELKRSKRDSDDEWGERNRSSVKSLFQDRTTDRSESEPLTRKKREKLKESTSPFRRKNQKSQDFKNKPVVSSSSGSSDEDRPPIKKRNIRRNSNVTSHAVSEVHKISDSESDTETVGKKTELKMDKQIIADKKKSDTLRKLFTPKRDAEGGGKGGGKGGKGGKGKLFFFYLVF